MPLTRRSSMNAMIRCFTSSDGASNGLRLESAAGPNASEILLRRDALTSERAPRPVRLSHQGRASLRDHSIHLSKDRWTQR
jgi:hypothetical protein